jgi:hypothetical protein
VPTTMLVLGTGRMVQRADGTHPLPDGPARIERKGRVVAFFDRPVTR